MRLTRRQALIGAAAMIMASGIAQAQDQIPTQDAVLKALARTEYSPYVGREYPTNVYWGDTHLHTAVSVDAGTMCRVGQEDAYRFARGEEITTTHGLRAKLSRPNGKGPLDQRQRFIEVPQVEVGLT